MLSNWSGLRRLGQYQNWEDEEDTGGEYRRFQQIPAANKELVIHSHFPGGSIRVETSIKRSKPVGLGRHPVFEFLPHETQNLG